MTVLIFNGDFVSFLNHFMITHFISSVFFSPPLGVEVKLYLQLASRNLTKQVSVNMTTFKYVCAEH